MESCVSFIKLFSDKKVTTLKSMALVVYLVLVILQTVSARKMQWSVVSENMLERFLPARCTQKTTVGRGRRRECRNVGVRSNIVDERVVG